jgi:hypothetical protein
LISGAQRFPGVEPSWVVIQEGMLVKTVPISDQPLDRLQDLRIWMLPLL